MNVDKLVSFKERTNGDYVVQWGEYIYLLPAGGAPRRLFLQKLFKKNNEWAGAFIYVPKPEALWIGIETGRGRDFVLVSFDELEKRSEAIEDAAESK